jgi:hypothetical protein
MTFAALLPLVLTYGPTIIPLVQKLATNIAAGKGDKQLTDADWDELVRLAALTSDDIYKRAGIEPPPKA